MRSSYIVIPCNIRFTATLSRKLQLRKQSFNESQTMFERCSNGARTLDTNRNSPTFSCLLSDILTLPSGLEISDKAGLRSVEHIPVVEQQLSVRCGYYTPRFARTRSQIRKHSHSEIPIPSDSVEFSSIPNSNEITRRLCSFQCLRTESFFRRKSNNFSEER